MKHTKFLIPLIASLLPVGLANAEPYAGLALGWTFNQKLSGIKGDENLNYPNAISTVDGTFYPGTSYSDIKLKDALQGGIKAGYYFDAMPNLGIEVEGNYSQPNMKAQNVTLTNPSGTGASAGVGIGAVISGGTPSSVLSGDGNSATEAQLPAKAQLLQFNFNAMYRYQGFKEFTPYIGAGPSINIIRLTGTGESGHFVNPTDPTGANISYGPRVSDTSVNLGANFKLGAEYRMGDDWGLGAEYHYTWSNVDISHFRSANNLNADLSMQSLSIVLTKHF